jgi:hypothetical protein
MHTVLCTQSRTKYLNNKSIILPSNALFNIHVSSTKLVSRLYEMKDSILFYNKVSGSLAPSHLFAAFEFV